MLENALTYVSICSGIEAATVAWHPLDWRPLAFAETDKFPSAVLAHHYPHVPNLGDITRFKEWPDARFDLLVGGTPCQSFSVAGLRQGFADPRGNLTLTYCAILDRYRPPWFLWENVPGVLSIDGGRAFGAFLGAVAKLGYGFAYRVLDAQYVRVDGFPRAVPQRRRRVFVVGHLGDWRRPAAVLFEPESVYGNSPPRRQARQDVAGAIGAGSARSGGRVGRREAAANHLVASTGDVAHCLNAGAMGRIDYETETETETMVAHTLKTRGRAGNNAADQETYVAHALRADGFDASEDGTGRGTPLVPIAFQSKQSSTSRAPSFDAISPSLDVAKAGGMAVAFAENSRAELRYEGGDGQTVSALKVGGGKPGQSYPAIASTWGVRRLMPVECERLQGFPDGYTAIRYRNKPAADGPRYKALGNSMAVPCMRWIGNRIEMVRNAVGDHHA